jgi:hypothetical protein
MLFEGSIYGVSISILFPLVTISMYRVRPTAETIEDGERTISVEELGQKPRFRYLRLGK